MWNDPIIEELHKVRNDHAEKIQLRLTCYRRGSKKTAERQQAQVYYATT